MSVEICFSASIHLLTPDTRDVAQKFVRVTEEIYILMKDLIPINAKFQFAKLQDSLSTEGSEASP
jgi:hypothetical protein